jgi:hypothetical protein
MAQRVTKSPPYGIPSPPEPDTKSLRRRELWNALEFFRIEGLLRAPQLWDLYKAAVISTRRKHRMPRPMNVQQWTAWHGTNTVKLLGEACANVRRLLWDNSLILKFAVVDGWAILLGSHHRYLKQRIMGEVLYDTKAPPSAFISEGIIDLSISGQCEYTDLYHARRYLFLRIDNSVPPEANIKELRTVLNRFHFKNLPIDQPTIDRITYEQTVPFHPRKNPPIKDICAWLRYMRCYDLWNFKGQTYEQIATEVYGDDDSFGDVDTVKKSISRVARLITAAKENRWPPANLE